MSAGPARRLRIALLAPRFFPEVHRGGERYARSLAAGLAGSGHRPRLITSHPSAPRRTIEDGLPVTRHARLGDAWLTRRGYEQDLTHAPFSYLSLRAGDDDVAHAQFSADAVAASRWSRATGRPAVYGCLGLLSAKYLAQRRLRFEMALRAATGCSAVTVPSHAAARAFESCFGVEPWVIHPPVDLDTFAPGDARSERPTIFCAAALDDPMKRSDLLLEAFRLLRRARPDARLLLLRPSDRRLATELERCDGVDLMAPLADARELARVYSSAWVSVLASDTESFGQVLAEALACGTPVVGPRLGAVPEIAGDGDGFGRLFEGADTSGFARALLEALDLADDPGTRARCRQRAGLFSLDRCVAAHEELYRDLLVRPARPRRRRAATTSRPGGRALAEAVAALVPPDTDLVLVDEGLCHVDADLLRRSGRRTRPFVERDGADWGAPEDDDVAIAELERAREGGARFVVFAWPAFWWFEHYRMLFRHLRATYPCRMSEPHLLAFELTPPPT